MEAAVAGTDSAADIERGVARRLARQAILRRENPPRYHAILDESVLLRTVAGRPVMRDQMRRLADAATEPHMKIQLMLLDRGVSPGANGVFGIISLPAPTPDVVHGESAAAGLGLTEDPERVRRATLGFGMLTERALNIEASRDRILAAARSFDDDVGRGATP